VLDILDSSGVEYLIVRDPVGSTNHTDPTLSVARMKNFSFLADHDIGQGLSLVDRKVAFDLIKGLSSNRTKAPYRRVYVSRRGAGFVLSDDTYPGYKDDIRVHNEDRLEEFLLSIGFEIVHTEDFTSFQEQIDLMAETSVLMAPTGSGLVNLGLLQDGQIVIELRCELLSLEPTDQRLINMYSDLSYACGHTHIAISNKEKDADAIIDRLRHLLLLAPTHITLQCSEDQ
jgi:capsular polysaccharide biosynthesis protein